MVASLPPCQIGEGDAVLNYTETMDFSDDRLKIVARLSQNSFCLAVFMCACALIGLAFNLAGSAGLLQGPSSDAATHPVTAICLCCLAVALHLGGRGARPTGSVRFLCAFACGTVLLHHTLTWLEVYPATPSQLFHGRVSVEATLAIVFLSLCTGLRGRMKTQGIVCLAAFLLIVMNCIIGATFGVTFVGGDLAALTLASVCFAALLAVSNNANHPFVRVLLLSSEVGVRARVMAMVGTLVPWATGMFLYRVWGMPKLEFPIVALMITVIIGTTIILAIFSGHQHQVGDELRQAAERRLVEQAVTDGLTGLRNRAGITQVLRRRMLDLKQSGRPVGIVMFDLDHFKRINDTHGHDEGDRVLVGVARCLEPLLRQGDVLGRWGGEEFMLIADLRQPEELTQLVERLRVAIHDLSRQLGNKSKTTPIRVSASFGVADMQATDASYNDAVKRADMALYQAKAAGRNCVAIAPLFASRVA